MSGIQTTATVSRPQGPISFKAMDPRFYNDFNKFYTNFSAQVDNFKRMQAKYAEELHKVREKYEENPTETLREIVRSKQEAYDMLGKILSDVREAYFSTGQAVSDKVQAYLNIQV